MTRIPREYMVTKVNELIREVERMSSEEVTLLRIINDVLEQGLTVSHHSQQSLKQMCEKYLDSNSNQVSTDEGEVDKVELNEEGTMQV